MSADVWDQYWRFTREAAAYKKGGPQDAALAEFWSTLFRTALPDAGSPRLLDIGCGNGVVLSHLDDAQRRRGGNFATVVGMDRSRAALMQLRERIPSAAAVAGEAERTPFCDAAFDLIVSQFGLEYAGAQAVQEVARLLAPKGVLAAILHQKDGGIYRECVRNVGAIRRVLSSSLIEKAKRLFVAGAGLGRQALVDRNFDEANRAFGQAVQEVAVVLDEHGAGVAGGFLIQFFNDLEFMYRRLPAYNPDHVAAWLDQTAEEMHRYVDRTTAMVAAALDETRLGQLLDMMETHGLRVRARESLRVAPLGEAAAWIVVCDRDQVAHA